jgi:hypothetical protein
MRLSTEIDRDETRAIDVPKIMKSITGRSRRSGRNEGHHRKIRKIRKN